MAIDKVKAYLSKRGMDERILEFDTSSATVELAAAASLSVARPLCTWVEVCKLS